MSPPEDIPSPAVDRLSMLHFAWSTGFLVLCVALWEFDKASLCILVISVFLLPPLFIAWLVGIVQNAVNRRWRFAASALFGPPLAGALIFGLLPFVGLDSERVHFFLVKYPHEIELLLSHSGESGFHSWSWGLDAPPLSPGIAYTLNYDPSDAELHEAKDPGKSIRSMGDHFFIVKESEDGSPL